MEEINQEAISISVPQPTQPLTGEKIWHKIFRLFNIGLDAVQTRRSRFQPLQFSSKLNFRNLKFNKKNILQYLILALILILVLVGGIKLINQIVPSSSTNVGGDLKIAGPVNSKKLNKEFKFSLRDEKGEEISKFSYIVESVELRKEILVKGQKATAIRGRIFLILNLKFVNTLKQGINVNARDYIRLSVNNSNELLAPDIHNDPVEVQAISTKYTRAGFAINETDKNLKLQIGEIDGKKETISLDFK
ncbi:MAG: hypothetical protein HYT08_01085 [Candidatus Levybacteria bacterium]|nr:hypothetical protein [Candidatus Levybacteria bacterium]